MLLIYATVLTVAGLTVLGSPSPVAGPMSGHGTTEWTERVVVNEFAPSGRFGDPTDEYVELHNIGVQRVILNDWELWVCTSPASARLLVVFDSGDVISPNGHLMLANHSFNGPRSPDLMYAGDVPDDGGWLLVDPLTGYTDGVGLASGLDCTEGEPASKCDWAAGEALTRDPQGRDTDDNSADFPCQPRTPGF